VDAKNPKLFLKIKSSNAQEFKIRQFSKVLFSRVIKQGGLTLAADVPPGMAFIAEAATPRKTSEPQDEAGMASQMRKAQAEAKRSKDELTIVQTELKEVNQDLVKSAEKLAKLQKENDELKRSQRGNMVPGGRNQSELKELKAVKDELAKSDKEKLELKSTVAMLKKELETLKETKETLKKPSASAAAPNTAPTISGVAPAKKKMVMNMDTGMLEEEIPDFDLFGSFGAGALPGVPDIPGLPDIPSLDDLPPPIIDNSVSRSEFDIIFNQNLKLEEQVTSLNAQNQALLAEVSSLQELQQLTHLDAQSGGGNGVSELSKMLKESEIDRESLQAMLDSVQEQNVNYSLRCDQLNSQLNRLQMDWQSQQRLEAANSSALQMQLGKLQQNYDVVLRKVAQLERQKSTGSTPAPTAVAKAGSAASAGDEDIPLQANPTSALPQAEDESDSDHEGRKIKEIDLHASDQEDFENDDTQYDAFSVANSVSSGQEPTFAPLKQQDFPVIKMNQYGMPEHRIILVDPEVKEIRLLTAKKEMRKQIRFHHVMEVTDSTTTTTNSFLCLGGRRCAGHEVQDKRTLLCVSCLHPGLEATPV
jgi:hypothetical protein